MKPRSYAPIDKVWLNSKYTKTKYNQKLKSKFIGSIQILHPVWKQANKINLLKKWKIHNIFHISQLKQNTTKKERVGKTMYQFEFKGNGNGDKANSKYKVKAI